MQLRCVLVIGLSLLAACSMDLNKFATQQTTPEERRFARDYLQLLSDKRFDSAFGLIQPQMRSDTARIALEEVGALLRGAKLDSMGFIGVRVNTVRGGTALRDVNLTYQMPTTGPGWLVANVATHSESGHVSVVGFSASPIDGPLEVLNRFTFKGKRARHYVWLVMVVLVPIVTIGTSVVVGRARGMPRRWLWVVVALVGSPVFVLNWTTGQVDLRNTLFLLFGAAVFKGGPAAPWLISFALPLGAAVSYFKVRAWRGQRTVPASVAS